MKRILLSALLAVLLCIPWTQAQTTPPFDDNFEGTTSNWTFVNGSLTNQWCIGTATNHGGSKAMYISNDGGTSNAYSNGSSTMVYAYKEFTLAAGQYEISYDWNCKGESSWDFLRVVLAPSTETLTAGTSLPSGLSATAVPSTWTALDGGTKLNLVSAWQSYSGDFTVTTAGTYKIVFCWRNDNSSGSQPPAAIDNFHIAALTCARPTAITSANVTDATADISWTAGASETSWEYVYGVAGFTPDWTNATTASSTSASLSGLTANTSYTIYVRSACTATDKSMAASYTFRTACGITAIPYTCGFEASEGFTYSSSWVDGALEQGCWSTLGMKPEGEVYPYYLITNSTYLHSGSQGLKGNAGSGVYGYWILPEFAVPTDSLVMELWYRNENTNAQSPYVEIGYMTDPTDSTTFVMLQQLARTTTMTKATQAFQNLSVRSTARIAVRFGGGSGDQYCCGIDDIKILKVRATTTPVVDSVYNITTTTAQVAFSGSNATSYRIVAATEPVSNPDTYTTWTIDTVVTASPATINVQAATNYYLYVQGIGQDSSFFSDPVAQFQSGCDVVASFPWTENFDNEANGVFSKVCWLNEHVDGSGSYLAQISTASMGTNTTPQLYFKDQTATTYTRVSTPEFNIPTAGAYEFNIDVYRSNSSTSKTLEGVQVIVDTIGGYDTTFIPRVYSNTAGVGAVAVANTWYTYTIPLPKAGVQRVILLGCNQWGANTYVDNLRVRKTPTCFKVDSIYLSDNQATQATIKWTGGTSAKYQVVLTSERINPDTLSTVPASVIAFNDSTASNVDSIVATGLTSATKYFVYVRGLCSDEQSDWSTAINFRSACAPYTISSTFTYTQDFESLDNGDKTIPCWNIITTATGNYPKVYEYEYYAHSGDKMWSFGGYSGTNDTTYMVLPETTNPASALRLRFWLRGNSSTQSSNDSIIVGYMTDETDASTFTLLEAIQAASDSYALYDYDFSTYSNIPAGARLALVRIPVAYYSSHNGSHIDDVVISLAPTCKKVQNFAASNLTKRSADLSWTATSAANYEVIVANQSIDPANLDSAALTHIIYNDTTITANNVTVDGLASLTTYYAYVRGNCGAGDKSDWSNGLSFQTAMAMNYLDSFTVSMLGSTYVSNYGVDSLLAGSDNLIASTYSTWSINNYIGSDSASIKWNVYGQDNNAYFATPLVDLRDATAANVSFDVCRRAYNSADEATNVHESDNTVFHVMISTDGFQTIQNLLTFRNDSVEGDPVGDTSMYYGISTYYRNFSIDLSAYIGGNVQVLFGVSSQAYGPDYDLHLDNISIAGAYDSVAVVANVNDTTMGYVVGAGNVIANENVTLTAVANQNYHFVSWSNGVTTETLTFYATQDTTFTATFAPDSFNITALTADTVMGTVTGSGRFPYNYTANLIATPNYGYHFVNWSNGDTTASTFVTVLSDSTITANFAKNEYTVTLVADPDSLGTVTGDGTYNYLDTVMVVATPDSGYYFRGWSNGEKSDTLYIVLTSDTNLTATFSAAIPHTVSADVVGVGSVTGLGTYNEGDIVTLVATAGQGYEFDGWSGDTTGIVIEDLSADTITFIVTRDVNLTATFTEIYTSVDDVEAAQYVAYTEGQRIVVTGVEGRTVSLFDATGRLIATRTNAEETETFDTHLAGVYMIKVNGMNTTAIVVK